MKCVTPEIAWNTKEAIYGIDFQHCGKLTRIATGGIDKEVKIWKISLDSPNGHPDFLSNLRPGHQETVNTVRFSPNGEFLASGDTEGLIIIWQQNTSVAPDIFGDDDDTVLEKWMALKRLKNHVSDVTDVAWSPDSSKLLSASMDISVIVWDLSKATASAKRVIKTHAHYVVGVKWDPLGRFFVSLSLDRTLMIYSSRGPQYHRLQTVSRAMLKNPFSPDQELGVKLFQDDSLMSFARRPDFSPDGKFLICPAGCIESDGKTMNCSYVFSTFNFDKPCLILPTFAKPSVGVRWCPIYFELIEGTTNLLKLPYRMVVAILTLDAVVFFDTQRTHPIALVSNIHYANLTDLSWSQDGRMLVVSSVDAFCTFITFAEGELGTPLKVKPTICAAVASAAVASNKQLHSPVPMSVKNGPSVRDSALKKAAKASASLPTKSDPLAVESPKPTAASSTLMTEFLKKEPKKSENAVSVANQPIASKCESMETEPSKPVAGSMLSFLTKLPNKPASAVSNSANASAIETPKAPRRVAMTTLSLAPQSVPGQGVSFGVREPSCAAPFASAAVPRSAAATTGAVQSESETTSAATVKAKVEPMPDITASANGVDDSKKARRVTFKTISEFAQAGHKED